MKPTKPQSLILIPAIIFITALAGFVLLMLYGNLGPKTEPPTDRAGFDLEDGHHELLGTLDTVEYSVLTLSRCPPQPTQQNEARQRLREAYGDAAPMIWSAFYSDALDSPDADAAYRQEGIFFPLIYHQGIEIEDAYNLIPGPEDDAGVPVQLVIRECYTGEDPLLKGFWRESIFYRAQGGRWVFDRFEGTAYIEHPEIFSTYLPLKEEYAWA